MKKSTDTHGLMTAQLGSIYDVPVTSQQDDQSTKPGSSVRFSETTGPFTQTEGATYKPQFKSFYTNGDQEVKYTTINKFEGRSSFFSYYPTTEIKEQ